MALIFVIIKCVVCDKLINPDLGAIDDVLDIIHRTSTKAPDHRIKVTHPLNRRPYNGGHHKGDSFSRYANSVIHNIMKKFNKYLTGNIFPLNIGGIKHHLLAPQPHPNHVNSQPFQPLAILTKQRPKVLNQGEPTVHDETSLKSDKPVNNISIKYNQGTASMPTTTVRTNAKQENDTKKHNSDEYDIDARKDIN